MRFFAFKTKVLYFAIGLFSIQSDYLFSSVLIKGNVTDSSTSFNFALGPSGAAVDSVFQNFYFYVSAGETGGQDFAIARAARLSDKFQPLAPAKIKLNDEADQTNPLYNAEISLMKLYSLSPIVVKDGDNKIYMFAEIPGLSRLELFATSALKDANGLETSEIIALEAAKATLGKFIFAAVKNNAGDTFGASGSGIAFIQIKDKKVEVKEEGKDESTAKTNKEPEEKKEKNFRTIQDLVILSTESLTGANSAIKIGNDATITSNIVDMHWDANLNRLYIVLQVSSNAAGSGARAVVIGRITQENNVFKLNFDTIAPDTVFSGNNQIVGTGEANKDVSLFKVRTMKTSTLLNYLLVLGGNGSSSDVSNVVYALPLVNLNNELVGTKLNQSTVQGTLAKVSQDPKNYFVNGKFFKTRAFIEAAQSSGDVLTNADQAAQVGAGQIPITAGQVITDMFVENDAVFVTVGNAYAADTQPGIFLSRPIFDDKGVIKSWTPWQRAAGTDDQIFGAAYDAKIGKYWLISGSSSADAKIVRATEWGLGNADGLLGGTTANSNVGLISLLNTAFPQDIGGIQGLFDFAKITEGLDNTSLLIATGLRKITIAEMASIQGGFFKPNEGDFATDAASNSNGTVPTMTSDTKFVTIADGALSNLGPIVSATIATNITDNKSWIVVGGAGGLAILVDSDGNGWTGDISQLSGIPAGLQFKKIGNYTFVQKLISDGTYLYVLTDNKLDRIALQSTSFKSGNLNAITVASTNIAPLNASFADFGVSDAFALLATTKGLFRVGNDKDIRTATNAQNVAWTQVEVPEHIGPVFKLLFISPTSSETDFASKGQVYALSSYIGFHESQVNRFYVNLNGSIDNNTITPLPDLFIKDKLSYLVGLGAFGSFRNYFFTDGTLLTHSLSKDTNENLALYILPNDIASGRRNLLFSTEIDFSAPTATQIGSLFRSSASGSILFHGDFGIRVNE